METIPEKPTARCAAQSTMPVAIAPDWEISARFPATGICAEKLALRFTPGIRMPRQLGPISLIPYIRAARSAASAGENHRAGRADLPRLLDEARDSRRRGGNHHKF